MSSVFTKLRLREWRGAARAAGTALVCTPPLPHPFTSLIFICAHFLSWPWMDLSSCSVQLYVYWIYSIVSHCACVSIQETASAFLEEQLLSAQALKREINQLVSSDWFWGGKKKGLSNCWLLNVSLAIFNSLLETYILWEFYLNYTRIARDRDRVCFSLGGWCQVLPTETSWNKNLSNPDQNNVLIFIIK